MFKAMPIAAIVENELFCVHSGIPTEKITLNEIESLNRFDMNRIDEEPDNNTII